MSADMLELRDNGGRRSGIDRRYYSYSGHIPERRKVIDRRTMEDRRQDFMPAEPYLEENDFERRGYEL